MAATKNDILNWLEQAKIKKAKYMMVICDTFDWDDYPVYIMSDMECQETYDYPGNMQKVVEVYDMSIDIESQIGQRRCLNLPK